MHDSPPPPPSSVLTYTCILTCSAHIHIHDRRTLFRASSSLRVRFAYSLFARRTYLTRARSDLAIDPYSLRDAAVKTRGEAARFSPRSGFSARSPPTTRCISGSELAYLSQHGTSALARMRQRSQRIPRDTALALGSALGRSVGAGAERGGL